MKTAAQHILIQMQINPRLAYLLGPGSQSYELLTTEAAQQIGMPVDALRQQLEASFRYEPWPERN